MNKAPQSKDEGVENGAEWSAEEQIVAMVREQAARIKELERRNTELLKQLGAING